MRSIAEQFKQHALSANGWIALSFLTASFFLIYYGHIYPKLADEHRSMSSWRVNSGSGTDVNLIVEIPKSFSEFQEGYFTLHITCASSTEVKCGGPLLLVGFLVDDNSEEETRQPVTLQRLDDEKHPAVIRNVTVDYDLKRYEVQSIPFSANIPGRIDGKVEFSVYTGKDHESKISWDKSTCESSENDKICVKINSAEAFKHTAIKNLLLPPWSNTVLPIVAFMMIWLAEKTLPNKKDWTEAPNWWLFAMVYLGAFFSFLLYAILYFYLLRDRYDIALVFVFLLAVLIPILPKLLSRGDS